MATELKLALDSVEVEELDLSKDHFGSLSLTERIDKVRPTILRKNCIGAVWLAIVDSKIVLTISYMSDGRALIQVVEHPISYEAEPDLAMAVKEILEASKILPAIPPHDAVNSPSRAEPVSVKTNIFQEKVDIPLQESPWSALFSLNFIGGIIGSHGPSTSLGPNVGVERTILDGFNARIDFSGSLGPATSDKDKRIQSWSLAAGLGLRYAWDIGSVEVGPNFGVDMTFSNMDIQAGYGSESNKKTWRFHIMAGSSLLWLQNETLGLYLDVALVFSPQQHVYRRLSNDELLIASPFVGWKAAFGVTVSMGDSKEKMQ